MASLKHTVFQGYGADGPYVHILKTAGTRFTPPDGVKMQPDMVRFMDSIKIDTEKNSYMLINAMGASEFWGANLNGDAFLEEDLKLYHKTFEQGHVYTDHDNNDPSKAMGRILFATYNDTMHRVELLVALDRSDPRTIKLLRQIEDGMIPRVSMGTRVLYDQCSICGHKAPTREDYCEHAKHSLGKLLPDGRRVSVLNPNPRFFEISLLSGVEADPSSSWMAKVASKLSRKLREYQSKESAIDKEVVDSTSAGQSIDDVMSGNRKLIEVGRKADERQSDMPFDDLEDMCRCFDDDEILGTAAGMGIKIRPSEFSYIKMRPVVGPDRARIIVRHVKMIRTPTLLAIKNASLSPMSLRWSDGVADMLAPHMNSRSMLRSYEQRGAFPLVKHADTRVLQPNPDLEQAYAQYIGTILKGAMLLNRMPESLDRKVGLIPEHTLMEIDSRAKLASAVASYDLMALNALYGAYIKG